MSSNNLEAAAVDKCCASCGKAEVDDIKLMDCDGCDLVKYCSDECKEGHRPEHEESCKKRVADLREELLFRQPEGSYLGDCPICYLPHSLDLDKSELNTCCSKLSAKDANTLTLHADGMGGIFIPLILHAHSVDALHQKHRKI